MHCSRSLPLVFAAMMAVFFTSACNETPVGLNCFIPGVEPDDDTTQLASPALDCQSRVCLHQPNEKGGGDVTAMCTADCESAEDCVRHPQSECETGFTCMVPVVVGDFCCRKMCVCKDYIVVPEDGFEPQAACDADNPDNPCCNLPGRPACGGGEIAPDAGA